MNPNNNLAPILLLVYNRPDHAKRTLESLMANDLANKSTLYIFADGPKTNSSPEQLKQIQKTRKVLKENNWCKEVFITELDENLGVDESTIKHVTEIINKYGKVIVLEDDIVTSKGFLTFVNDALNVYEFQEEVMNISGYMFPIKAKLPETVLLKGLTGNWGWATWKRAWDHFKPDYNFLAESISSNPKLAYNFNIENSFDYLKMLKDSTDQHKPWDVRWYASVFLKNGYCLWPGNSLIQNIGHDASGTHCGESQDFTVIELSNNIKVKPLAIRENLKARTAIRDFNNSLFKVDPLKEIKYKISKRIPNFIKQALKKL